ncbi:hypothetical protein EDD11_006729 [Mortierella claussenii]|nr:hypothetical protein EDD11_006729 [Mortierella claussenii]
MANDLTLFCLVDGQPTSRAFSIKISSSDTVGDLRELIKIKKANNFHDVDADMLQLWLIEISEEKQGSAVTLDSLNSLDDNKELDNPRTRLSTLFPDGSPGDTMYVMVQRPPPGQEFQALVAEVEDGFFVSDSVHYKSLIQFVKGDAGAPTTEGSLGGLPFVLPRSGMVENRPSLLFLNLPESSATQNPPSTADKALKRAHGRVIPLLSLFGVAGCGKTRTAIEMLSKHWGFYFNGSATDWGSSDLLRLVELVKQRNRYQTCNQESNTHVQVLALALVLTRIMVLHHCLNISEHEGVTFTCKHWMLLQVGFQTMGVQDLYLELFSSIATVIHNYSINAPLMGAIVQERFSGLRERLLGLTSNTPYSNFSYKILLVVDEAQNLGKEEFGTFISQYKASQIADASQGDYMRLLLSPLIHGFYQTTINENQICVIPCGTGLSIFDMQWLDDSAPVAKGYKEQLGPFTDFVGWESLEQLRNYRDLVRRSLPNQEAMIIFDSRVPDTAMPELFDSLRGRFRPIVSAFERMIKPKSNNGGIGWKSAIKETEDMLTSAEPKYQGKGNIVYDIGRMIERVHKFKSRYTRYQNIQATLQLFVLEHYLHGRPVLINREEAPLVEASVGRILHTDQETKTVLDEPFALRAAVNYFSESDPDFHSANSANSANSAICNLLGPVPNASVQGHTWELAVLPSLVHVFHDKVLSQTTLVPKAKPYDSLLDHTAKIAGKDVAPTLGIDYRSMSLEEFLAAHVENGSLKDGKPVPPFYRPAEKSSGPDIVFVLHFEKRGSCPVFIQLKMRASMNKTETQSAYTTVKADAVQGHLGEATTLRTFCTVTPKRCLGVVIAYPAELAGHEGLFPIIRPSERIRAAQGEQTLEYITFRIDKNNIRSLFPKRHMEALDRLKGIKRELNQDGDDLADEQAAKYRRCDDDEPHMDMDCRFVAPNQ